MGLPGDIHDYARALKTRNFRIWAGFLKIKNNNQKARQREVQFIQQNWRPEQIRFEQERSGWDIINKSRQVGISTMECARDVFYAITRPRASVVILGHDQTSVREMRRMVGAVLTSLDEAGRELGAELYPRPNRSPKDWLQRTEIEFANGSFIQFKQAKQVQGKAITGGRGLTIDRLHSTETAFYAYSDDIMGGYLNAAGKAEEVVIETTPNGARGWYYETFLEALEGKSKFKAHFYPFWQNPEYRMKPPKGFDPNPTDPYEKHLLELTDGDISRLAYWRLVATKKGGTMKALKDYPIDPHSCFQASDSTYLHADDIQKVSKQIQQADWIDIAGFPVAVWEPPMGGAQYVIGSDVGDGIGQDYSALYVLRKGTGKVCASCAYNEHTAAGWAGLLAELGKRYNGAIIAVEKAAEGRVVISKLQDVFHYWNLYRYKANDIGWHTNHITRPAMLEGLKVAVQTGLVDIPDAALYRELKDFKPNKAGKVEAAQGKHDDRVMAFCIALAVLTENNIPTQGFGGLVKPRSDGMSKGSITGASMGNRGGSVSPSIITGGRRGSRFW